MLPIARSKVSGSLLVVLGFAVWFGSIALIPNSWEWWFAASSAAGGLGFFVVGCFLPEYPDRRFLERKGALRLMAFLFWQSVFSIGLVPMIQELSSSKVWIATRLFPASLVIAFGSYFLALFLIRGFRAGPENLADSEPLETRRDIAGSRPFESSPEPKSIAPDPTHP